MPLAVRAAEPHLAWGTLRSDLVAHPKLVEHAKGGLPDPDRSAHGPDRVRLLVDDNFGAASQKCQGGSQTDDAAACNGHPKILYLGHATVSSRRFPEALCSSGRRSP